MIHFGRTIIRRDWGMVAVLLLITGCGKGGVGVSGEVTYDGKPIDSGSIVFIPADGVGPSRGTTITDGKFIMEGPQAPSPGKKIVKVTGALKTGRQIQASAPAPPGMMIEEAIYVQPPPQEMEIAEGQIKPMSFTFTSTQK